MKSVNVGACAFAFAFAVAVAFAADVERVRQRGSLEIVASLELHWPADIAEGAANLSFTCSHAGATRRAMMRRRQSPLASARADPALVSGSVYLGEPSGVPLLASRPRLDMSRRRWSA